MAHTIDPERMRKNFAAAAALCLAGHVKHSNAYSVSVTEYRVTLQGSDADAMQFVAETLGVIDGYSFEPGNGFHQWAGVWSDTPVALSADGPLSEHEPDATPDAAIQALAAEAVSSRRIDPPGCGCTDCITGESRPAETQDEYQAAQAVAS